MILNKKDIDPAFDDEDFYATWPTLRKVLERLPNAFPKSRWIRWLVKQVIKVGDFVYSKGELEE